MALKQVSPQIEVTNLGPVRMWRDDLEKMENLIREAVDGRRLSIHAEARKVEFVMDSVSDMKDIKFDRVDTIKIETSDGKFSLEFGRWFNRVHVNSTNLKISGMTTELIRLSRRCRRFRLFYWLMGTAKRAAITVALYSVFAGVATYLFFRNGGHLSPIEVTDWLPAIILWTSLGIALLVSRPFNSRLFVKTRADAPPFWSRKRDDLVINIFALLVGGVIGYFVNQID